MTSKVPLAAANRYIVDRGMAPNAKSIHDINPALVFEKITRERIYESMYWKELCYGLDAATLCDRASELKYIGGTFANHRVSPFLCLVFKMVQLQPEPEIVLAYANQDAFKYLTAMALFYIRLYFSSTDIYVYLESFLKDYRKLRCRSAAGWSLTYMDEFVYALLTHDRVCDMTLPYLTARVVLEDQGLLTYATDSSDSGDSSDSETRGTPRNPGTQATLETQATQATPINQIRRNEPESSAT